MNKEIFFKRKPVRRKDACNPDFSLDKFVIDAVD